MKLASKLALALLWLSAATFMVTSVLVELDAGFCGSLSPRTACAPREPQWVSHLALSSLAVAIVSLAIVIVIDRRARR